MYHHDDDDEEEYGQDRNIDGGSYCPGDAVSGLGKIAQFLFAWIHPGNNIITGGVAEAGAQR